MSPRRASRIALALASGVAVVALLPAAPAQAVTSGGIINGGRWCSAGQRVTGGGASVIGEGSGDFNTRIEGSEVSAHFDHTTNTVAGLWATTIRNTDGTSHQIGLFGVCVDSVAGYQVVSKDVTVVAGGFLRDIATCPVGTAALGGGANDTSYSYNQPASGDRIVQESSPGTTGSQSLWLTALRNNDTVSHLIRLFAVCANTPAGYQIIHKDLTLAAGGFVRDTARCPVGSVVLSGGAAVVGSGSADFKTRIQESAPGVADSQSLWMTALRNSASVSHTISLYAVCANPIAGYQVVSSTV
ncbi:hypothetical protein [Hamadaea tsunoensis]|uniref:hypothetical protein n=1 Tax=Hamadaea tsunoensis TaxID=53368 RepID=UPI00040107FC|nr:hypothetical protein [Hamadaea tsunoensis]